MFINEPCPHLPEINGPLTITHTRKYRQACDRAYFQSCLQLAQSLWQAGSPAQAILQLDKSMMATTGNGLLDYPYAAIVWIIKGSPEGQFLGNPVRHFQHLASRMNLKQPNGIVRVWRAWACLHLTENNIQLANTIFPRDKQQIEREQLIIPSIEITLEKIATLGSLSEARLIQKLLSS